jgi:hypothetical protein
MDQWCVYHPIPAKHFSLPVDTQGTLNRGRMLSMKSIVRMIVAVGAAAISVIMFGVGVASADELTNVTYADASAKISEWNMTAVIATVVGDQLSTDDCTVTRWQKARPGEVNGQWKVLLSLNCNQGLASAVSPGSSLASPEGRQAKADQDMALQIKAEPARCTLDEPTMEYCRQICKHTGLCEVGAS